MCGNENESVRMCVYAWETVGGEWGEEGGGCCMKQDAVHTLTLTNTNNGCQQKCIQDLLHKQQWSFVLSALSKLSEHL